MKRIKKLCRKLMDIPAKRLEKDIHTLNLTEGLSEADLIPHGPNGPFREK